MGEPAVQQQKEDPHLARTTRTQLIDDISGEHADENLRFALDGTDYEIDLTRENAAELRAVLEKYVAAGRRLRGVDSLEKTLLLGKIEGGRRRGRQRIRWLDGITDLMDMRLSSRSW